jgi:3-oxoacyl-[acyl-carrier protein] reductase
MTDTLLKLAQNAQFRKLVRTSGLPIPMPQTLARAAGAWVERPLVDRAIVVGAAAGPRHHATLAGTLAPAGASAYVVGRPDWVQPFIAQGEAYGRPPVAVSVGDVLEELRPHALVFDASGVSSPSDLKALYDFFHGWLRTLQSSGRIVVLGRVIAALENAEEQATQVALDGFIRSLAKEVGKKGVTAQLVRVGDGAEDYLAAPLRFLLSDRSTFVTGQVLVVAKPTVDPESFQWTRPLDSKVALVTGAARGIGAATAHALGSLGAHVICLDRPQDDGPLGRVAQEVGGSTLLQDITEDGAAERIARDIMALKGGVDVVVHNAGITRDKTLARMKSEWWDQAVDVNLGAVCRITERLRKDVLNPKGRLLFLSSVAGIAGNYGQTNYGASKAGVAGYARALATACAKQGITANAIAPGFIETRLTDAMPVAIREVGRRFNALSQGGHAYDVANVIAFLASPGAQGVSGQVIRVCGGNLIGA